jgi:PAS domain S-box-containing protein
MVDTHDRPFAVIGHDFTVITVNRAYERTFQVHREQLVGSKCHSVLHKRDRPCFEEGEECPYVRCFMTHQPCSCLHTHYDRHGRPRWVRVNLYPLRGSDGEVYVGEMLQEIAARDDSQRQEEIRPVGVSPLFLRTMEQLEQAARTDAHVLLIGETGTGKEMAANFIHGYSDRRKHPFIALDCTVVTESLFESEVFGHERGAFTGSVGAKKGLFEVAGGGTLFLDEIGEATLSMQAKLLRVLETGQFRRVGGNQTLEAKARIVCATNRHLLERVKSGEFREDLYYRIACFCVRIPSLRERMEDLPALCEAMLEGIGRDSGHSYRLTGDALRYLSGYQFPGNIRELRNILQVVVAHGMHSTGGTITRDRIEHCMRMRNEFESLQTPDAGGCDTPGFEHRELVNYGVPIDTRALQAASPHDLAASPPPESPQAAPTLQDVEARHIAELLRRHGGNRKQVAAALGISERTLYRKLKRYDLRDIR